MSLEYIRDAYKITAKIGGRVEYTGCSTPRFGTIRGAQGAHLLIQLDGQERAWPYHPTWQMRHFDDAAPSPPADQGGSE